MAFINYYLFYYVEQFRMNYKYINFLYTFSWSILSLGLVFLGVHHFFGLKETAWYFLEQTSINLLMAGLFFNILAIFLPIRYND